MAYERGFVRYSRVVTTMGYMYKDDNGEEVWTPQIPEGREYKVHPLKEREKYIMPVSKFVKLAVRVE